MTDTGALLGNFLINVFPNSLLIGITLYSNYHYNVIYGFWVKISRGIAGDDYEFTALWSTFLPTTFLCLPAFSIGLWVTDMYSTFNWSQIKLVNGIPITVGYWFGY